LRVYSKSSIIW